ncbi:MAG: copper resistance system multicopper oxidase [Gammaproteobacteria bacterium]|jgi:CopA family copper-resistance protein|nr:copper resistance system multicopper oxidase [Gammaproteobacteria bacterium]
MRDTKGPVAPVRNPIADPARRRFVRGLALGGVTAGLGLWRNPAWALNAQASPEILRGTDFDLRIGALPVNLTGRQRLATVVNDSLPAPTLYWREGDTVTLRVSNRLAEASSIHWHGVLLPAAMDGVPGLSFNGIEPGETHVYRFPVRQAGTYWYHSHSGLQEQTGVYGAIVIEPRTPDPVASDRDYVVVLSDWTDENPARVAAKLKKQSDYYNFGKRTVGDFVRDVRRDGFFATVAERRMWGDMRMNPMDLADVSGYTYTYLMNGKPPAANWTGIFSPGERIRLRFVNAGAMTIFDVRIPGLQMTVVASDGQPVKPVTVDEFRLSAGETCDVIVTPGQDQAYTLFAQSMDRSGFAAGTLAPRAGMRAVVPVPDRRVPLTMADMGHAMPAAAGSEVDHSKMDHSAHAGHDMSAMQGGAATAGIRHAPTEFGPAVDMRVDQPSTRLDDPGVGLRDNGRRVLTYADLESTFGDPDGREPGRTIELHVTGNMERYRWSFNGQTMGEAGPIRLTYGERVRFVLVNDTMMDHPIHLHGMWSDLEDEAGRFKVRKHTINIRAGQKLVFRVTADAFGRWAFHCHLALHMAGIFRVVIVDRDGADASDHGGHQHG